MLIYVPTSSWRPSAWESGGLAGSTVRPVAPRTAPRRYVKRDPRVRRP